MTEPRAWVTDPSQATDEVTISVDPDRAPPADVGYAAGQTEHVAARFLSSLSCRAIARAAFNSTTTFPPVPR